MMTRRSRTRVGIVLASLPSLVGLALASGLGACKGDEAPAPTAPSATGAPTATATATGAPTSPSTPPTGTSPPPDAATPDASSPVDAGGDTSFPDPLAGVGAATLVKGGFTFLEGPQWLPAEGKLVFSDVQGNRMLQLVPPSTEPTDFRNPSAGANGNAIDRAGALYTCEHTGKRVARLPKGGALTTLVDTFGGAPLNSPNDLIVRSDGTLYFTDPNYAGNTQPAQNVFRLPPGGALTSIDTLDKPNGVALSPDERTLYVAVASAKTVRKYAVRADGSVGPGATFVTTQGNSPDGIAVDDAGNLYTSTSAGVEVWRPDGTRIGAISVAQQPANVAFGGADRRTLYITARTGLFSVRVNVPGPP